MIETGIRCGVVLLCILFALITSADAVTIARFLVFGYSLSGNVSEPDGWESFSRNSNTYPGTDLVEKGGWIPLCHILSITSE